MPQGIPSHFLVYAQESGQTKLTFEECFVFGLSFLAGDLCLRKFCLSLLDGDFVKKNCPQMVCCFARTGCFSLANRYLLECH